MSATLPLTPASHASHNPGHEAMDLEPRESAQQQPDPAHAQVASNPTAPEIDYSPQSVPYNEAFENALMTAILYPDAANTNPTDQAPDGSEQPIISPTSLPLPLSSPLRTHASPILGVKLTHPGGYHTGGPGPAAHTVADFARQFISEHGVEDAEGLQKAVATRREELMEVATERMREREEAVRKNDEVRRELEVLEGLRSDQVRVAEKMRKDREARRG